MATGGGSSRLGMMIVGAYLVAVNVGAAGLFYYDKQCAIRHQWRVRESTLSPEVTRPRPVARSASSLPSRSAKTKHGRSFCQLGTTRSAFSMHRDAGWAGGILAMQTFRHKTAKSSFQVPRARCLGLHAASLKS